MRFYESLIQDMVIKDFNRPNLIDVVKVSFERSRKSPPRNLIFGSTKKLKVPLESSDNFK